jgi:serine-type D-Ala-D-Ala endopeptidase (penicillin-binding protein 7)
VIALSRSILIPLLCCAALVSPLTANAAHHKKHHKVTAREVDLIARAIAGATDQEPLLASSEVLVLDEESNDVLLSKNSSQVQPMASITKLMTALVVLEADQPMDQMLEITEADEHLDKPTFSRLKRGTLLTRAELLHLALMASENRAAHALARNYPGGIAACIEAMNAKAGALGMDSTRYVEPTGLSPLNVASPEDLSKLVIVASNNQTLQAYSTDQKFAVPLGRRLVEFHTTDKLVAHADWHIVMQKTGYIAEAGKCLVMKAIIESRSIVIVLMNSAGAQTRLVDAQRIKSWLDAKALKLASAT